MKNKKEKKLIPIRKLKKNEQKLKFEIEEKYSFKSDY